MRIERPAFEAWFLVGYATAYVAFAAGIGLVIRHHPAPLLGTISLTADLWYLVAFKLVALLLVPVAVFHAAGYRARDLISRSDITGRAVAWTVVALLAGLALNLQHLGGIADAVRETLPTRSSLAIGLGIVVPLVTAAVPEELVFRGLVQTRLEATIGRIAAILISTSLFAAWHLPSRFLLAHGVEGTAGDLRSVLIGTGIPVFVVGLVFALLWDRYRCLPALIALHWGIDILPTISSFIGIRF